MKTTYIYALIDPDCNEVRYVGKADNPQSRLTAHFITARRALKLYERFGFKNSIPSPKDYWLICLMRDNKKPYITILEKCQLDEWRERERYWIRYYLSNGIYLVNNRLKGDFLNRDWYEYWCAFRKRHYEPEPVKRVHYLKITRK